MAEPSQLAAALGYTGRRDSLRNAYLNPFDASAQSDPTLEGLGEQWQGVGDAIQAGPDNARKWLEKEPGYTYSTMVPAKQDASGKASWALPDMVRDPLIGALDLAQMRMQRDESGKPIGLTQHGTEAVLAAALPWGGGGINKGYLRSGGGPIKDPAKPFVPGAEALVKGSDAWKRAALQAGRDAKPNAAPTAIEQTTTGPAVDNSLEALNRRFSNLEAGMKPLPATRTTSQFAQPGATYEDLLAAAQRGDHMYVDKNGKIIGAPSTFRGADDIIAAREHMDKMVDLGAPHRNWYGEGAEAIKYYSPTKTMEKALGTGMGVMSPNSSPDFATETTIRMINNMASGSGRKAEGLTKHGNKFIGQFDDAANGVPTGPGKPFRQFIPDSNKVEPYTDDILNGGLNPKTVNDLWRGRANAYPENASSGSFTDPQHNYMWGEGVLQTARAQNRAAAGHNSWTPAQTQAAEWVGQRATALMAERDARIAALHADAKLTPAARQKQINLEPSDAEVLASANEPISKTLEKRVVNVAVEAIPGRGLKHHEGIIDASEAERAAYSKPKLDAFVTKADPARPDIKPGYDTLYTELGYPQRPVRPATGEWTAPGSTKIEHNPVNIAGVVMPTRPAKYKTAGPDQKGARTIDAVETLRAGMLGQHAIGSNRFLPLDRKAADQRASGIGYGGSNTAGAVAAAKAAGLHTLDIGGNQAIAGRFYDPMRPKDMVAAGEQVAAAGFPNERGQFYAKLTESPKRPIPGSVTANIASKFQGVATGRVAEQLDEVVRSAGNTLKAIDQSVTQYGPTSQSLVELNGALGSDGLVKLVQATRGMSKKDAISYYASRGLPGVGALILSDELLSRMSPQGGPNVD